LNVFVVASTKNGKCETDETDRYTQSIKLAKYQIFGKKLKKVDSRNWGYLRRTFEVAGWASNNQEVIITK
jgi:hypothetical protein